MREEYRQSLAHSQVRRITARAERRRKRLHGLFSVFAAIGATLLVSQIVAEQPIYVLVTLGAFLCVPLAATFNVRL